MFLYEVQCSKTDNLVNNLIWWCDHSFTVTQPFNTCSLFFFAFLILFIDAKYWIVCMYYCYLSLHLGGLRKLTWRLEPPVRTLLNLEVQGSKMSTSSRPALEERDSSPYLLASQRHPRQSSSNKLNRLVKKVKKQKPKPNLTEAWTQTKDLQKTHKGHNQTKQAFKLNKFLDQS